MSILISSTLRLFS